MMYFRQLRILMILMVSAGSCGLSYALRQLPDSISYPQIMPVNVDTVPLSLELLLINKNYHTINLLDSLGRDPADRYDHLTDADFELVAAELDVEVAAIKAVVEIEAGKAMKGFWAPGIPVINFDRSMYLKYRNKAESKLGAKGEKVPEGLKGYALREWTELIEARKTNAQGAYMGTFWGMFQIGGFNYKICGCETVDEFVERNSYSELEQLQLFAVFIVNTGMVESLRNKDWRTFARKYNGASYAKRGYHTRMAKAYKKYSNE